MHSLGDTEQKEDRAAALMPRRPGCQWGMAVGMAVLSCGLAGAAWTHADFPCSAMALLCDPSGLLGPQGGQKQQHWQQIARQQLFLWPETGHHLAAALVTRAAPPAGGKPGAAGLELFAKQVHAKWAAGLRTNSRGSSGERNDDDDSVCEQIMLVVAYSEKHWRFDSGVGPRAAACDAAMGAVLDRDGAALRRSIGDAMQRGPAEGVAVALRAMRAAVLPPRRLLAAGAKGSSALSGGARGESVMAVVVTIALCWLGLWVVERATIFGSRRSRDDGSSRGDIGIGVGVGIGTTGSRSRPQGKEERAARWQRRRQLVPTPRSKSPWRMQQQPKSPHAIASALAAPTATTARAAPAARPITTAATASAVPAADWRSQYRQRRVVGDGNCMFRAMAVCLGRGEEEHAEVRQQVARRLLRAPFSRTSGELMQLQNAPCEGQGSAKHLCACGWDLREGFATNIGRHCASVCEPGVWGDVMELITASYCFNAIVEIVAVEGSGSDARVHQEKIGPYGKYRLPQYAERQHEASNAIRLVYHVNEGGEHYNAALSLVAPLVQ